MSEEAAPAPVVRPARAVSVEPMARRRPGEARNIGYLYILPAFVVYGLFVLLPLIHSAVLSFYEWDGVTPGRFIGFDNYGLLLADPVLKSAFAHAFVLIAFYSLLPVAIGLLLASSIARVQVRGLAWFRTILFLPQVMPLVVVAVVWRWIYSPQAGPLNQGLDALGLDALSRSWLGDFTWALPAVGLIGTWVMYGLCMVLFIAGVQKIPQDLYDAARVDGAGPLWELRAVTLPHLRNEIAVALTLTVIAALRNFDLVYLTTKGGPGTATAVPALEVYNRAFTTGQVGVASTVGICLAAAILVITLVVGRIERGDDS